MINRSRIYDYMELLKTEIDALTKENVSLHKSLREAEERIRRMISDNKKLNSMVKDMSKAINDLRCLSNIDLHALNPPKRLKLGNDWMLCGDLIADISLEKKFYLSNPIERCFISKDNKFVFFSYGNCCFFLLTVQESLFDLDLASGSFRKTFIYDIDKFDSAKKNAKIQFSMSADEKIVIVLYGNELYTKWDVSSMRLIEKKRIPDIVASYMIQGCLYYLTIDKKVCCYETELKILHQLDIPEMPIALKIAKIQSFAFLKITDRENLFVNLKTGKMRKFYFSKNVEQLTLSEDGILALTRYDDGTFTAYKVNYEDFEFDLIGQSPSTLGSFTLCSFMKNPRFVLAASKNKTLVMMDLKNKTYCMLTGFFDEILYFQHNDIAFCTACADGRLRIWKYSYLK